MMDVTDSALVAAGSLRKADGLFITARFNCPLRTLKCHRVKLCSTHATFILMDVAVSAHMEPQVSAAGGATRQKYAYTFEV